MKRGQLLYEGKAKNIFEVIGQKKLVYLEYKNSLTALNGLKKGEFENKAHINRNISSVIFRYLEKQGLPTHWKQDDADHGMIVKKVTIIPIEVVVRNILAGSTAKKFNIQEGQVLEEPLVEFFYKDDALGDPFISDEQALMLKIATPEELKALKDFALKINKYLISFFKAIGLKLIDFKVEFGKDDLGTLLLSDEISPDSCRLWDEKTNEKLDKDRFRRDLGGVQESYQEVLKRIQTTWEKHI